MPEEKHIISLPVIRVKQPIGDFYIGCISAKILRAIARFDIRRIQDEKDNYLGFQREITTSRIKEIKKYVSNLDATFPTGVIIAVAEECATLVKVTDDDRFWTLQLSSYLDANEDKDRIPFDQIAIIIDGQHRMAGLEDYERDDFEINVIIFIGADISDQASIFSTVNLAQTKVNKSLVYDLFSYAKARSPQRTCHEIVVTLDRAEDSPFFRKIKRLGVATQGRFDETLSQATFVKALLKHISSDPNADQDILKRGKKLSPPTAEELSRRIFRNLFVMEQDEKIANIVWNYFDAVRQCWPNSWISTGTGNVLNRTNGFNALMRFLRPAYRNFTTSNEVVTSAQFLTLFNRVKTTLADSSFTTERYNPGSSGEGALYSDLMNAAGIDDNAQ